MTRRPLWFATLVAALSAVPGAFALQGAERPLALAELEERALARHPTLAQAAAAVQAAEGRRRQAGLLPNPVFGYRGEELTFDRLAFQRQSEHFWYLEQAIVTGRKLKRGAAVYAEERARAEAAGEVQRQAVRNAVRGAYHDALVAGRLVEVRAELARIARAAVTVSQELLNVGQADRPDVLEAEIEAERAELALGAAREAQRAVWLVLGALTGEAGLAPQPLAGDPERDIPQLEHNAVLESLLSGSPEITAARASARRELATIERARSERIGDVVLQGGIGYNSDRSHGLGGWVGGVEVQFPLPVWNRQQGAIAAARAEASRAEAEVARVEVALRTRLAHEFLGYRTAHALVERYREAVIPKAELAHSLYLARFREMTAAYPQVLIAQRTLFQVKAEYLGALAELWRHVVLLQGFLIGAEGAGGDAGPMDASAVFEPEETGGQR
jgi:cobalt-zinc-cadmium efflux system outer membrane protein